MCAEERKSEYSLVGIMSSCVTHLGCQVLQVKKQLYTHTLHHIM